MAERGDDLMFYTYGGHPASCAIADRVLEIMEREQLVARAEMLGEKLRARLAPLGRHPHVAQIRGKGLLIGLEFVRDRASLEPFAGHGRFTSRVVAAGLSRGVFFYPGGTNEVSDAVLLGPPFVIGDEEIETIARVLEQSIDDAVARIEGRAS
jgi:adenosylmethionine-8-amino-7-oxononanoate aminotransferase